MNWFVAQARVPGFEGVLQTQALAIMSSQIHETLDQTVTYIS